MVIVDLTSSGILLIWMEVIIHSVIRIDSTWTIPTHPDSLFRMKDRNGIGTVHLIMAGLGSLPSNMAIAAVIDRFNRASKIPRFLDASFPVNDWCIREDGRGGSRGQKIRLSVIPGKGRRAFHDYFDEYFPASCILHLA